MNTFEQMLRLNDKIHNLMIKNKGVLRLTFYDGTEVTVRVLRTNTDYNFQEQTYVATIITFTDNIGNTTNYNLGLVRDIN